MTGNGVSICSPTTRWSSRSWFTRCASTNRARATPSSARSTSGFACPPRSLRGYSAPPPDRGLALGTFGEGLFNLALERKASNRGLGENQLAVGDYVELTTLAGRQPGIFVEAGLEY